MKRCIIADDVRASREMLGRWLHEYGYDCSLVADGQAARIAAEVECPDLIITDIEMPKFNGLELLAAIRSHVNSSIRTTPVIVISSLNDARLVELVGQFGASCVLSKPLDKLRLKEIVETIESGIDTINAISPIQQYHDAKQIPAVSPKLRRMADQLRDQL